MTECLSAGAPDVVWLPLAGVRAVDLTDKRGGMCGRLLADLGAEVLLVEPPGGASLRSAAPVTDGASLLFAAQNANKRGVELDWRQPAGRDQLLDLVAGADILIEDQPPGCLAAAGLGSAELRHRNPRLVITSITDFGQTGPYRDWVGTNWVHMALSSVLSRSGSPGLPPLMPPGRLAYEHAAAQAAWVTLVAYWSALETGSGERADVSVLEATVQSMDAAFGIGGSATGGVPASDLPPGRPDAGFMYPIFPCADGHVRICLLAKRQWRAMFGWLGEPADFADPKYDKNAKRYADRARLYPLIGALFAGQKHADLVAEGQRRGIPIESVNTPADVLADDHLQARGAWAEITLPSGRTGRIPQGCLEVNGRRAGYRASLEDFVGRRAPRPAGVPGTSFTEARTSNRGPLSGLRVLDLGVIVVGAETGRLFADLGADVIKVESKAFPDGSRASSAAGTVSASFAWGHRNKRSMGIDLRSPQGKELFLRLAAVSDVVLSNFKPGTLEALGLGYDALREANAQIVVVDSSALGSSGPASRRMGYGPLVRARTGLTSLWRYPDQPESYCDAITVYPDHTAARIGAAGALAALIARRRTGQGGIVSVSQAEVMLTQFSAEFLRESLYPGSMVPIGNRGEFDAPWGVYACAGEDQWCVITVRGDHDWRRLAAAIEAEDLAANPELSTTRGRLARRETVERRVGAWTSQRTPTEVMTELQQVGVPAAAMLRVNELRTDPHLAARGFFTTLHQPQLGDLPTETGPAAFDRIGVRAPQPAPLPGQHTREIAKQLLELDEAETERLLDRGVLEESVPPDESRLPDH